MRDEPVQYERLRGFRIKIADLKRRIAEAERSGLRLATLNLKKELADQEAHAKEQRANG